MDGNASTFDGRDSREVLAQRIAGSAATEPAGAGLASYAEHWLAAFQRGATQSGLPWYPPHVSGAPDEIVLEWRREHRNLTVFLRPFSAEVLKVWGASISDEMEEVELGTDEDSRHLWNWLLGG